ncbi:thermonuclease family protein [uncultured Shimia sp.]|uniref:thermonuclease family protein n=1 Tax=uncultured Shimia sp. TaxID=573152 RepID=UPI0026105F3E|nr:thermonuclease family protein [uncultured Shimia sp.]
MTKILRLARVVIVIAILAIAAILSFDAIAQSSTIEKCGSAKRVTCVVDGDTIWFEGEKIRLKDFDTPEPTTNVCGGQSEKALASKASSRLLELLNENEFTIDRDGKDKYGRTLAKIRIGGKNVGDILISEGLARSWPDGDEFWCD